MDIIERRWNAELCYWVPLARLLVWQKMFFNGTWTNTAPAYLLWRWQWDTSACSYSFVYLLLCSLLMVAPIFIKRTIKRSSSLKWMACFIADAMLLHCLLLLVNQYKVAVHTFVSCMRIMVTYLPIYKNIKNHKHT